METSDPEGAFNALRYSHEDMRRESVELRKEIAQLRANMPADYGPTLEVLAASQRQLGKTVDRLSVEITGATSHSSIGSRIEAGARSALEGSARQLRTIADDLIRQQAKVRDARTQKRWLWGVGIGAGLCGFAVGLGLVWSAAAIMPQGIRDSAAIYLAGESDAWDAGLNLIERWSPAEARDVQFGQFFYRNNKDAVETCWGAAVRTGVNQDCVISVPAPSQ